MFDLDISKMIIVGIVALAVIPPKDLPRVMRTVGQTVGKMRRMAAEFQGQFMEAMREVEREADLDSVKKEFQAINDQAKIDTSFDPVRMMRDDITKAAEDGAAQTVAPGIARAEAAEAQAASTVIGASEIGTSEIALTGPERAADALVAVSPEAAPERPPAVPPEAAPEPPAARRSAAE
jgi:sec-independent protein translocase protein TatB